jgi:1,4-alpha-glucan branching enzyme/maltooligosyltrehalose trehalohydrolase
VVREFFLHNARYWLEEYRFDGLRFDAVHAIIDDSPRHILDEICASVPAGKHLVLENDANQARFIGPGHYSAQWNDDAHHACHVLATGETDGYYVAYADAPARHLARCLAEGFAYQGEVSPFTGKPRGERSAHLAPACFVDFLQNHDQIGNRALGERITRLSHERALKALTAIQLLAPSPPLLFMGEEWGCQQPFLFFCDFDGELGEAVRRGRRREFPHIKDMPDPVAAETFRQCVLKWKDARTRGGKAWLGFYRELLQLRREHIVPLKAKHAAWRMLGERAFEVRWDRLLLVANCGDQPVSVAAPAGRPLWSSGGPGEPWSVGWWLL